MRVPSSGAAQPPHFAGEPFVGGGHDDLAGEAAARQFQRDGQAVRHLVDLVVVEQETDAHVFQYRT